MGVADFFSKLVRKAGSPKAVKDQLVLNTDPTENYHHRRHFYSQELTLDQLPRFTIWRARQMMYDPQIKIGMDTRNAALLQAEVEVESDNPKVKEWVQRQFDFLWNHHFEKMVRAKRYGYAALQINWKENKSLHLAEISGVKEFDPADVRALTHGGAIVGFSVRRNVNLLAPRSLWITYGSEFGHFYGDPILRGTYSPWWEKYMDRGYKNTLQIRMLKDAYRGDVIWYPEHKKFTTPEGDQLSMRDVAREVAENTLAGGTRVFPSTSDSNGNKEWDYQQATDAGNPTGIIEWGNKLDLDIWKSLGVFPEVIEAATTGSGFSGRSVPFVLFVSSTQVEFNQILEAINEFVLRPGVTLNFGKDAEYEIKSRPLVETFAQDMSGTAMGGGAIGGQQGEQGGPIQIPAGQNPTPVREPVRRGSGKFLTARQFDEDFESKHPRADGGEFTDGGGTGKVTARSIGFDNRPSDISKFNSKKRRAEILESHGIEPTKENHSEFAKGEIESKEIAKNKRAVGRREKVKSENASIRKNRKMAIEAGKQAEQELKDGLTEGEFNEAMFDGFILDRSPSEIKQYTKAAISWQSHNPSSSAISNAVDKLKQNGIDMTQRGRNNSWYGKTKGGKTVRVGNHEGFDTHDIDLVFDIEKPPTKEHAIQQFDDISFLISRNQESEGTQFDAGPTDSTASNADEIIEIGSATNRKLLRTRADDLIASLKKKRQ